MSNYILFINIYWLFNQLINTRFDLQQISEIFTTSKVVIYLLYFSVGLVYFKKIKKIYIILVSVSIKSDFIFFNNFYVPIDRVNVGLFNSAVITHPPLLLSLLIFLLYKLLRFVIGTKSCFFLTVTSVFTMFLGSFWSSQEIFWEGFWNWDFIEVTVLLLFYCYFKLSHSNLNKYSSGIVILSSILFIKIGSSTPFMSSIHSFSGNPIYRLSYSYPLFIFLLYLFLFRRFYNTTVVVVTIIYVIANYSKDFLYIKNIEFTVNYITSYLIFILSIRYGLKSVKIFYRFIFQKYVPSHFKILLILYSYLKFFLLTNCMLRLVTYKPIIFFSNSNSIEFYINENILYNINIFFKKPGIGIYVYNKPTIDYLYCVIS